MESTAEIVLGTNDLKLDRSFFEGLGFRVDHIYPTDDPSVAVMSGHGLRLRIDRLAEGKTADINILTDRPEELGLAEKEYQAPNGSVVRISPKTFQLQHPPSKHKFEVRKLIDSEPWIIGRAGMLYRDLIPDRLGGSIMASHIRIPNGGPVPDVVHYHTVGFQLIFCYKGWVRLVYEDQGPPFQLKAGECVTQPPEIRHRVLEASDDLQVVEIAVPAEHMTTIDHEMELPNSTYEPDRSYNGQLFCHHKEANFYWSGHRLEGMECRDTGVHQCTDGIASVEVVRPIGESSKTKPTTHGTDILFSFVLKGHMTLVADRQEEIKLEAGEAFVIPPKLNHHFKDISSDFEYLEVSLPGKFETYLV